MIFCVLLPQSDSIQYCNAVDRSSMSVCICVQVQACLLMAGSEEYMRAGHVQADAQNTYQVIPQLHAT